MLFALRLPPEFAEPSFSDGTEAYPFAFTLIYRKVAQGQDLSLIGASIVGPPFVGCRRVSTDQTATLGRSATLTKPSWLVNESVRSLLWA